ncbi:MAG: hypothetical protein KAQ93_02505 [Spirochaetales bacterium]|nr:hypothetical protein [Spirochaetales bacterium]
MNKISIFIVTIFFLLVFVIFADNSKAGPDKLITEIYLKNGFEQFETGNYEEAFSLSEIALSFSKNSSDALFIRAVTGRSLGFDIYPKDDLARAIILDNWKYYNEITARVYLSKYMYLDGDVEGAYLNLLPFSNELAFNTEYTELFIRMSLNLGKVDEALNSALSLLMVDPYDNYSQLIMSMYDPLWLAEAESILIDGDPSKYLSQDVFKHIIKNGSDCVFLNSLYLSRWGEDRFYIISNACKKTNLLPEILIKLYPDNSIVTFSELKWIYSSFEDENSKKLILDRLSSIDLTIKYDSDADGFIDTEAYYNNGQLFSFNFDSNHDDFYDYFVELNEKPVKLKVVTKTSIYSYNYKNYPFLINVLKSDRNTLVEYQLIPYKLAFEIISIPIDFTYEIPHILENIKFPDNDILTESSTYKTMTNGDDNIISNYSIIGLDESIEKIFDSEGVKIIERHYRGSVLISVYKDFNEDGVFDTVYDYKNGILQKIFFDENNNGISEYTENYENGLISSWDFNEDGLVDSREHFDNGIIYRELSSKLDGIFDIFLEITSDME